MANTTIRTKMDVTVESKRTLFYLCHVFELTRSMGCIRALCFERQWDILPIRGSITFVLLQVSHSIPPITITTLCCCLTVGCTTILSSATYWDDTVGLVHSLPGLQWYLPYLPANIMSLLTHRHMRLILRRKERGSLSVPLRRRVGFLSHFAIVSEHKNAKEDDASPCQDYPHWVFQNQRATSNKANPTW